MKTRKILSLLLALALVCALLAGCGASNGRAADMKTEQMAAEAPAEAPAGSALNDAGTGDPTALPESRKWIVTVQLSAETEDLDAATAAIQEKIDALEGYVEQQRITNGSQYESRRYRSASMTIRVPAQQVDAFTQDLAGIANVVRKDKSLEDVTLRYVATESRVKALETEEKRLLELLAQAQDMSDLLAIEARLTDVRYELESTASQLRLLSNQIDYATVYLDLEEVREFTPVEEPTVWVRIRDGFVGSLKGLGSGLVDLTVWLLASSPYLALIAAITVPTVLIVKKNRRKRRGKKAETE
ncbi:MAG: DUF4349 domain-containing protein [Eubacteriales bacterium]|nr:DUF4349 domain-containing protein [Eubacteriales bacterium]